jgi:hypothetical protein
MSLPIRSGCMVDMKFGKKFAKNHGFLQNFSKIMQNGIKTL